MFYYYLLVSYAEIAFAIFSVADMHYPLWPIIIATAIFQSALIGSLFDARYFKIVLLLVMLSSIQFVIYPALVLQNSETVLIPSYMTVVFEVFQWILDFVALLTIMLSLFKGFTQLMVFMDREPARRLKEHLEKSKALAGKQGERGISHRDQFESEIHDAVTRRASRLKMDFTTANDGTYKDPRVQEAYTKFSTTPAHERTSDNSKHQRIRNEFTLDNAPYVNTVITYNYFTCHD